MRNTYLVISLFIVSICSAQDVDLLWKARAIRAQERLDSLKNLDLTKCKNAMKIAWEIMLENAFKNSSIAKVKDKELIHYHLIIYTSSDLNKYLDVSYIYNTSDKLVGFGINKLPTELRAALIVGDKRPGADNMVMVGDGKCNYCFIKTQPFDSFVLLVN